MLGKDIAQPLAVVWLLVASCGYMGGDQCQNGGSNLEGGDFKLRGGILQVERGYTSS